ncbi:DNA repair protein rad5 [Colletotrichum higginsianum]|nr:DNA repair protein rad5 [Colletotrichum higginsianum]
MNAALKHRNFGVLMISRHFSPGAVSVVVFHGPKRSENFGSLTSANIVLTTYATVVAEDKGKKLLQELKWFRIVLDEAHWIRNASSKQFKAVTKLSARNRWCLTGTPIQNKLEDIASLAAFLQLQPFPTMASFRQGVLDPLSHGGNDFAKPLRSWLRAVCIRRTEKLLQLPDCREEVVTVFLSETERQLYVQVLHRTKRDIDDIVSKGKSIKKYNVLFTAILKMRMLCNTGTFLRPSASEGFLAGTHKKETGCERCTATKDEDSALLLMSSQFCPDCDRALGVSSPMSDFMSGQSGNSPHVGLSPAPEDRLTLTSGHSEKLTAVIQKIVMSDSDSKHIVFSYWTSTLDLLSNLLHKEAVHHVQVDGRTSHIERSRRLEGFKERRDIPVLLMSVETGALGLNLTAANCVHIVEPQWNPSVEEQAVARALRMGQKRNVTVFRYVTQGTVEQVSITLSLAWKMELSDVGQNIMHLQKKKKSVAKFMFNADTADELDGKIEVHIIKPR